MSANRPKQRKFDLVIWGATGFTGRLVAEHLFKKFGADGEIAWAIAGRNAGRLAEVCMELTGDPKGLPVLIGDSTDAASLDRIAAQTRVICATAGPFALYGSEMVGACARHGTDYCDITGEVQWVRKMIDAHQDTARQTGARLVHCCGFDSIPSDLGTLFTQRQMEALHGGPCESVKFRVRRMKGAFSGGTVASLLNALDEARADRDTRRIMGNPYGLNPKGEQRGPDGPDQSRPQWDEDVNSWTAPFVMAAVNTRVVRRSNALTGYSYGKSFRYEEAVMTGRGPAGLLRAVSMTATLGGFLAAASLKPGRALMGKLFLPQPGEGPSEEARESGYFDILLVGRRKAEKIVTRVRANRDPGYGATSRMLGESAVCLAKDELQTGGGSWTPASCMGEKLIERLTANAGMSFEVQSDSGA